MKKWQISKPKIFDWYLFFSKELKSVISSFKICFQNYGQLKRKFLRPKITSSTFLKFELSSHSGAMLKTRKNTIRNQFEQQRFDVISFQKPRRVYPAIWYNLKPFADMKGRFKLSTPATCTSHVRLSKGKHYNKPDHRRTGRGGEGGCSPPKFGQLRFFGRQEKTWAKPVFKDVSMFFIIIIFWRHKYFLF